MTKIKTLTDCPEWLAAQQKLAELQTEFTEVDQEISRIVAHRASENDRDVFADAAAAMLNGGDVSTPAAGNDDQDRELRFRRKVLRLAIDQHKRAMIDLQIKLSEQLCAEAKPEYSKAVREVANAGKKLLTAMEREQAIRFTLGESGVHMHSLDICFPHVQGRIENFLQQAEQQKHI